MTRVGLIVNPAAGRDIRRLTGGASVVDNYAKRRVAECVLDGLTVVPDPPAVSVMPDKAGIASHAVAQAPEDLTVEALDIPVEQTAADTRRAAVHFREQTDAVVTLGGDGTTRDVALALGETPLMSVSTGTNNVVPTAIDGTVAGAAAALVATGVVNPVEVTSRHSMVEARAETPHGEECVTGLAAVEISDRSFVGTRAVLDPDDLRGGVVTRAHPGDIGLSGVAGAVAPLAPDADGGVALRLTNPANAAHTVRAIIAPGMTATIGIAEHQRLASGEPVQFDVADGVVGADGERELELVDTTVEIRVSSDGPQLINVKDTLDVASRKGALVRGRLPIDED